MVQNPILIEEENAPLSIDDAPTIDDDMPPRMSRNTLNQPSKTRPFSRYVLSLVAALFISMLFLAIWDFVANMTTKYPHFGKLVVVLLALLGVALLIGIVREIFAMLRLGRADRLYTQSEAIYAGQDTKEARAFAKALSQFYSIPEIQIETETEDVFDACDVLHLTERKFLGTRDQEALAEIETKSRQIALVTAFLPMALVDLAAVLILNLRMIRRVAEIYGASPGFWGGFRLWRKIMLYLLATGAVALTDDMLGSLMGGSLLAKLSKRFGEGVINAALGVRLGIAAMEVCRPMGFHAVTRPKVNAVLTRVLTNSFSKSTPSPKEEL